MYNKNIKNLIGILFITILLFSGIFIFFNPTVTSGFRLMQSDSGDTLLNNLFLEHSFRAVFDGQYLGTLESPLFFYPLEKAIAYGDNLWGSAPIYWLTRIFFVPETAFQLWMIIISSLNFFSFYLLARSLKIKIWLAGFASFIFAFCIPRSIQIGHQQLLPQFYSILALLFLIKFFELKKLRYFILFEFFVYLQLLAGVYLGWFFVLAIIIYISICALFYKGKLIFKLLFDSKLLISLIIFLLLLILTFSPYHKAQELTGNQPFSSVRTMLPQAGSYISVPPSAIFYKLYPEGIQTANDKLPMKHEHILFLGVLVYILLFFSVIVFIVQRNISKIKEPWPPIFVVSLAVFILITLISLIIPAVNYSFWINIYNFVPGAGAIRAVSRIWTISYLFLILAIFILASRVYEKTHSNILKVSIIILALLSCVEQINLKPYSFEKLAEDRIQKQIDKAVSNEIINNKVDAFYIRWAPGEKAFYDFQIKAMWASIALNLPTLNGYGGKEPFGYKNFRYPMGNDQIIEWVNTNTIDHKPKNILILNSVIIDNNFFVDHAEIVKTKPF